MSAESTWIWAAVAGAAIVLGLLGWWIWLKGRKLGPGEVFRASRFTSGNRLFPTQVLITETSVVHYTPQWIGKAEESIHIAHISSMKIDTGLLFSDVVIETTGGANPVRCHGHKKGDAVAMKALVERHQQAYYTAPRPAAATVGPDATRR